MKMWAKREIIFLDEKGKCYLKIWAKKDLSKKGKVILSEKHTSQ
jgi:hypothetical protein